MDAAAVGRPARRRRWPWLVAVAAASFVVTLYLTSDRLPTLTAERLGEARDRWRRAAVLDYDLVVETEGSDLAATAFEVRVRGGKAESVASGGRPATGDAASYTVDGLFGLIEREMELASDPARSYGAPSGYRAYLHARFDPERGVPIAFRRTVGGTGKWAEWRVRELTPR